MFNNSPRFRTDDISSNPTPRRKKNVANTPEKREAGKAKLEAIGLSSAWTIFETVGKIPTTLQDKVDNGELNKKVLDKMFIVFDIVQRLVNHDKISDKQINFLVSLVSFIDNFDAMEAKRKAEKEAANPAPEGRVEVEVQILKIKDTDWGTKMFCKSLEGWTCWGSLPRNLIENDGQCVKAGDVVCFTARFKRADNDDKHAFFSRPTKAVNLTVIS
tara:strand:+ start:8377 stop:9024 length:648 start_codon:yes stop_codon:yes gene_type:complete